MPIFKQSTTSQKIALYFSLFTIVSLILLVLVINIVYFYIWYSDIKKESLYDMNVNYSSYAKGMNADNKEAFTQYILQKDTIISPNSGELVCSEGVAAKLHNNEESIAEVQSSFFYRLEGKTYFVFTQEYDEIGEVSILYDTTEYVHSQKLIIQVSLVAILLFTILNIFIGRTIARRSLKNLIIIAGESQKFDLEKENHSSHILIDAPVNDEIQILATTLNTLFQKIKQQSNTQKQFITDVSHEFKTPLMVMSSKLDVHSKMLEKCKQIDPEKMITDQKQQIKKLNKLIETLLYFSKLQEGADFSQKMSVDVVQLSDNIIADLGKIYPEKQLYFTKDVDIKGKNIQIHPVALSMLLENLYKNAFKFSNRALNLTLRVTEKGFSISDNCLGINEEVLGSLWEKFQRGDTKLEGFGIGLFLVKRICDMNDWTVSVESSQGAGTKFIIEYS